MRSPPLLILLLVVVLLLLLPPRIALANYDAKHGVVELTAANFDREIKANGAYLVVFHSPTCGHCVTAAPEYHKAAAALKGIVKVGAVDMSSQSSVARPYGVQGFPTFKIFIDGKPQDYNGARTAAAFTDAVLAAMSRAVKARLGGNANNNGGSSGNSNNAGGAGGKVEELGDTDFDRVVLGNHDEAFMVAFTAPWCGHCQRLKPEWANAAKKLGGTGVRVVNVDATAATGLASRFKIQGFPTIKFFGPGPKSDDDAEDYNGAREAEAIVSFALDKFERMGGKVKVDVDELTSDKVFETHCASKKKCVMIFLEDILDAGAKRRNQHIETIKNLAKRARHLDFVWLAANAQPKWEETLNLQFGFPAVVLLREAPNGDKLGFVHKGKFDEESVFSFVSSGKNPNAGVKMAKYPEITKTTPWDGKEPPKEGL